MTRWHACLTGAALGVSLLASGGPLAAQYKPVEHRKPAPGEIEVKGPGSCAEAGKTYLLTEDVRADASALFLGKDVTVDLNGYTVTYAGAKYEHVPNYGFEQGLAEWDVSKAPGAKVEDTETVKPFIGKKILRLPAGQEIASKYIALPVADRSWYAQCGVLAQEMKVTIRVEDEKGEPVQSEFRFGSNVRKSCPQSGSPKLGGGFVFAHLHHQPAGKYRLRVRADTDALIDEADIRPALDVGIGIVEKTYPWAYYKCILDGDFTAFFDYTRPGSADEPVGSVPKVAGPGKVTIRNGVLRSGFEGIRSWAVQSTAKGVTIVLENVKIAAAGINTNAICVPRAVIKDCRFEIATPFIIDRHRLEDSAVALTDAGGSEVSASEFIGGQGCLAVEGAGSVRIHDNRFVNRQTVTNHYSIMLGKSEGVRIERNRFEPEIGSGILMFSSGGNEVAHNTFKITAANGNCEYANTDYSTNAIRITDYNAKPDAAHPVVGNRIHHNTFHITGKFYPNYKGCVPIATALFVSVGAAVNHVEDNEITVDHQGIGTPAEATAFYVGGSDQGGEYLRNRITTNVAAFWIGTPYGPASNVKIVENTIIKAAKAPADFKPFRFGWWTYTATNVEFVGNKFEGCEFAVQATDAKHTFTRK
jgi:hypothetical protein